MRARIGVGGDLCAIALIGVPIDKAFMVVWDEHLPLRERQFARALLACAGSIEGNLTTALAIYVGTRVDRIGEHMIDGDVAGVDPADFSAVVHPQGKRQTLAPEPQPDATYRSEFGETRKNGLDRGAHGFVWVEEDLAILLTPNEAHGKIATQFAARSLVADPAEQTCPQHMQLRFAHGAFEAKQ